MDKLKDFFDSPTFPLLPASWWGVVLAGVFLGTILSLIAKRKKGGK